jgi:hypothetical protein
MEERSKKKRGPKGGMKHRPGREHDRKSAPHRKRKFQRRAKRERPEIHELARRQWEQWDALSDEKKKLPWDLRPKIPRPEGD